MRKAAETEATDYANEKAAEYATEKADAYAIDVSIEKVIDQEEAYKRVYDTEFKVAFAELFRDRIDRIFRRKLGRDVEDEDWDH
ncbi:MAG: hypothetical protein ACFCUE_11440 [Candidatus Bathyarchaeia archaeon]|jgi:hypothetical protein